MSAGDKARAVVAVMTAEELGEMVKILSHELTVIGEAMRVCGELCKHPDESVARAGAVLIKTLRTMGDRVVDKMKALGVVSTVDISKIEANVDRYAERYLKLVASGEMTEDEAIEATVTDMRNADMRNADMRNADMRNADMRNAAMRNARK